MSEFNFIQKPGFFQSLKDNLGNRYDKACGGIKQDRVFVGNYNSGIKAQEEAKRIYFRVVEYKEQGDIFPTRMLVFYNESVIPMPSFTGNQIKEIQNIIKSGKGKGYIIRNKVEAPERIDRLPDRVTPENLYYSGKFYDVNQFMKR